jgi:hypothetical protein
LQNKGAPPNPISPLCGLRATLFPFRVVLAPAATVSTKNLLTKYPLCGLCDLCAMLSSFACSRPSSRGVHHSTVSTNPSSKELDRLFVDRQDDATGVAVHLMPRSRWIDDEGSLRVNPTLVPLRAGQNQNVLISDMFMQRHLSMLAVSEQSSRRPCHSISIEPEDIDPFFVWFPSDLILLGGKMKNVFEFERGRPEGRL